MPTVTIKPLVQQKINALYKVLLEENYFATEEDALLYCNNIEAFIMNLPTQKHRTTKDKSYGRYYATYKANRNTSWYITFDTENNVYLVRNIFNNHTPDYPLFIAGSK